MAVDHKVTLRQAVERTFKCPRCGAHGEVEFHAIGEGGWARESVLTEMFNTESAVERSAQDAAADLTLDADRVVSLIRCPSCEQRAPGAFTWPAFRVGLPLIVAAVLPFVSFTLGLGSIVLVGFALWVFSREYRRVQRADRVEILKLEIGADQVAKAKAKAKARFAPKPTPRPAPKPIVVPVVAPVIEKSRGPDEGPAFLVDRKP